MPCPSLELLDRLASAELAEPLRASVAAHAVACERCRTTLDELRENLHFARHLADIGRPPAVPPPQPLPGYRLVEPLRRGGQAQVWRAERETDGRPVAVKLIALGKLATADEHRRLAREIAVLRGLHHPNIVEALDDGAANRWHYLVLEFVDGLPLLAWLDDRRPDVPRIVRLFVGLCAGVAHAHEHGVIHRDLKPTNVLVEADDRPRVLDFGLARRPGHALDTGITQSGAFLGTIAWAAPEQLAGEARHADARSDVYALGCLLYRALADRHPHRTTDPEQLLKDAARGPRQPPSAFNAQVSAALDDVVLVALDARPERRHASARELLEDLRCVQAGDPPAHARAQGGTLATLRRLLRR